jgi:hypothetical protein
MTETETILIEKAELQQLTAWIASIEEAVDYINENVEGNPYECLDQCKRITKILNKIRGLLIVLFLP